MLNVIKRNLKLSQKPDQKKPIKNNIKNKPLGTNGPLEIPFDTLTAHKIDILIKQLLCQFEELLVF